MSLTFRDLVKHDFQTVIANSNEFGASVSIKRGAFTTTGVSAKADLVQTAADAAGAVVIDYTSRDYLIARTDYRINAAMVEPAIADVITDNGYEYEVLPIDGDQPFTWNDEHGLILRIHTKRKGAAQFMPSTLATIADEVAEILTDASAAEVLSQEFEAERVYEPRYEKEDTTLRVFVIAVPTSTTEIIAGDMDAHDYVVEIGIFKRVDHSDADAVDPMVQFVEEVRSFLRDTVGEIDGAKWQSSEIEGFYDPDQLKANVFAGVQRVTYRSWEDTRPNAAFDGMADVKTFSEDELRGILGVLPS